MSGALFLLGFYLTLCVALALVIVSYEEDL